VLLFSIPAIRTKIEQTDLALQSEPLTCLAFSPRGDRLATGGENGQISVFSTKPKLVRLWSGVIPYGNPNAVAFTADGKGVAWTAAPTEHAYIFDAQSGSLQRSLFFLGKDMNSIRFLPDGKSLLTGGQSLTIWDISQPVDSISTYGSPGAKRLLLDIAGPTDCLDVDKQGKTIVACGPLSPEDRGESRSVVLIDRHSGKIVRTLTREGPITHTVGISGDSRYAVAGDVTGELRIWQLKTGRLLHRIVAAKGEIRSVSMSPKAKTVAATGGDGIVRFWSVVTGKKVAEF